MVFRKEAAPKTRTEFMDWYNDQTKRTEGHSYDDPSITSPELRDWFLDMIQAFPAMNGPYATDLDSDYHTGYCIGRDMIYVDFRWSLVDEAYATVVRLAKKHQVGFYDVSSDENDILFPENGDLKSIGKRQLTTASSDFAIVTRYYKKPWWKFW